MIVLNYILKYLNTGVIIGSLLSLLAPKVDTGLFWPIAFFGLLHPVFLILNILFLIYWTVRKKVRLAFNLAVFVLSIGSINKILTFGSKTSPEREGKIKVISFNAKLFGVYGDNSFYNEFSEKIGQKNADIICIQEFYNMPIQSSNILDVIKKETGLKYHYYKSLKHKIGKSRFGIIIFSRYKIVNYGELDFGPRSINLCIFADLKVEDKIIRVYNVHLQSLKLERTDYDLLKRIGENKDSTLKVTKNIYERLKEAFIKRGEQAKMLKTSINNCGKETILCGDFNDTPQSFAYQTLSKNMLDCFMESGNGLGGTYVGPLPSLRIDYILHDTSMVSYNYLASKMYSSDHKLVEALIEYK